MFYWKFDSLSSGKSILKSVKIWQSSRQTSATRYFKESGFGWHGKSYCCIETELDRDASGAALFTGRIAANRKLPIPVYVLLRGQKSAFSPRGVDSLHWFMWNLVRPSGTWVRLAVLNFTSIGAQGCVHSPQIWKFTLFGRVAPQGQTIWQIPTSVSSFYAPNYPA